MIPTLILAGVCLGVSATLILMLVVKSKSSGTKQPPGPTGLPFVGQGFSLSVNSAHLAFTDWAKTYGDIVKFKMFGRSVVILNNPDIIRKAFVDPEYAPFLSDRPPSFIGEFIADSYKDILFRGYDGICQKLKSITLHALHSSGEGSQEYQNMVHAEIKDYVHFVTSSNGANIDIIQPLDRTLCKIIGILFTGGRLSSEDEMLQSIERFDFYGNEMIIPTTHLILKNMPFLRLCPGTYGRLCRRLAQERDTLRSTLLQSMKESYRVRQNNSLLHALFNIQEREEWLTDDYILGVVMDLINTSTLTSRGVLSGFLFLLVHFPDVQQKIHEEICDVIGRERDPCPDDMGSMPYTVACILEVLRYQSHLGITATHTNSSSDVIFEGYTIPKGSSIYGNQWIVHHDERYWEQPFEFKPERFLNEDGTLLPADHDCRKRYFMPFGVGHRSCMGINMTYNRMFTMATTILQNHALLPPHGVDLPPHHPKHMKPGTVLQAPDFLCRVVAR